MAPPLTALRTEAPDPSGPPQRLRFGDHLPEELAAQLAARGIAADEALGRRLVAATIGRRGRGLEGMRGLSREKAAAIAAVTAPAQLEVAERHVSPTDGFARYVFRLEDGARIEAVRIPVPCEPPDTAEGEALRRAVAGQWRGGRRKYVVCVSSQAGCALGCAFCATATLGFRRNLHTWEIVGQILAIRDEADRPVGGVVFMGMGEPFLNYDAVLRAARLCSHPAGLGISAQNVTLSTAGIVPGIRRFTAEGHRFRLAVSLTSARPEVRRVLMPIERKHSTEELVAAVRDHAAATRERVTIAYVCIGGEDGNCTEEDARALGALLRDVPIRLDLIDVNGALGGFQPPSAAELKAFRDALGRELPQPVARRYSGGKDVDAACGMLAARTPSGQPRAP